MVQKKGGVNNTHKNTRRKTSTPQDNSFFSLNPLSLVRTMRMIEAENDMHNGTMAAAWTCRARFQPKLNSSALSASRQPGRKQQAVRKVDECHGDKRKILNAYNNRLPACCTKYKPSTSKKCRAPCNRLKRVTPVEVTNRTHVSAVRISHRPPDITPVL